MKERVIEVYSARLNKWMMAMAAIVFVVGATLLIAILIAVIDNCVSENGNELTTIIAWYDPFIDVLTVVLIVSAMAMATLLLYNYFLMHQPKAPIATNVSPLRGAAIAHENEIIELLKVVAQPLPDKTKLNRAHTAQFLQAMKELGLIDPNFVGRQLMVWVEDKTSYVDGSSSAFTQALNAVKNNDSEVARLKEQLSQIVGA